MKEKVDINTWNRKLAYTTFKDYTDPYTGIVAKLDVTNLVNLCKQYNLSFYGSMTYFVL